MGEWDAYIDAQQREFASLSAAGLNDCWRTSASTSSGCYGAFVVGSF